MTPPRLEVCAETLASVRAAEAGGADRIELCAALAIGGLTPPASLIHAAATCPLPVHMLCRPRAGGFVQDSQDAALVANDIRDAAEAGLAGVVIGASLPDRRLDTATLARWIDHARTLADARGRPLSLTLHRAFDLCPDPLDALDAAIALGFDRVLTSGGAARAIGGVAQLESLVRRAAGRIGVLAAGGIDAAALPPLVAAGVREFHGSCRVGGADDTASPERRLGFGDAHPPGADVAIVRELADAIRRAAIVRERSGT